MLKQLDVYCAAKVYFHIPPYFIVHMLTYRIFIVETKL
jgi:hypothetical protein